MGTRERLPVVAPLIGGGSHQWNFDSTEGESMTKSLTMVLGLAALGA